MIFSTAMVVLEDRGVKDDVRGIGEGMEDGGRRMKWRW
jgi:hypothetical protein